MTGHTWCGTYRNNKKENVLAREFPGAEGRKGKGRRMGENLELFPSTLIALGKGIFVCLLSSIHGKKDTNYVLLENLCMDLSCRIERSYLDG